MMSGPLRMIPWKTKTKKRKNADTKMEETKVGDETKKRIRVVYDFKTVENIAQWIDAKDRNHYWEKLWTMTGEQHMSKMPSNYRKCTLAWCNAIPLEDLQTWAKQVKQNLSETAAQQRKENQLRKQLRIQSEKETEYVLKNVFDGSGPLLVSGYLEENDTFVYFGIAIPKSQFALTRIPIARYQRSHAYTKTEDLVTLPTYQLKPLTLELKDLPEEYAISSLSIATDRWPLHFTPRLNRNNDVDDSSLHFQRLDWEDTREKSKILPIFWVAYPRQTVCFRVLDPILIPPIVDLIFQYDNEEDTISRAMPSLPLLL